MAPCSFDKPGLGGGGRKQKELKGFMRFLGAVVRQFSIGVVSCSKIRTKIKFSSSNYHFYSLVNLCIYDYVMIGRVGCFAYVKSATLKQVCATTCALYQCFKKCSQCVVIEKPQ